MSEIRLRLATIVNLVTVFARMAISIAFIVLVARRLSIDEFAVFGVLLSIYLMLPIIAVTWQWWAQRYVGQYRGLREAAKALSTGLVLTLLAVPFIMLLYLALSLPTIRYAGLPLRPAIIASIATGILIVAQYFNMILAVLKPEIVGVSSLIHEVVKLASVTVLIILESVTLEEAIVSLVLASLSMAVFAGFMVSRAAPGLSLYVDWGMARTWLSSWRLPIKIQLTGILLQLIRPTYTWITGYTRPVAYLNISLSVASPLTRIGQSVVPALYARSLRESRAGDLQESIRLFMLFTFFMASVAVVASKSVASIYSPQYVEGHYMVLAGVLFSIVQGLTVQYRVFVLGSLDLGERGGWASANRLITLELVLLATGIIVGAIVSMEGEAWVSALTYLSVIIVFRLMPLPFYARMVHSWGFRFPWRNLAEVSLAGSLSSIYLKAVGVDDMVVERLTRDLPALILHIGIALVIYLVVLYLVSPWFRGLVGRGVSIALSRLRLS